MDCKSAKLRNGSITPPDPLFRFENNMGHIHCICFAEDDPWRTRGKGEVATTPSILLAAGESGIVHFWDLATHRMIYKQMLGVSIQTMHSYRKLIVVQEKHGLLKLFSPSQDCDKVQYTQNACLPCITGFCRSVRVDADTLLVPQDGANDAMLLILFDMSKQMMRKELKISNVKSYGQLMCIDCAVVEDKQLVVCAFESGDVISMDCSNGQKMAHTKLQQELSALSLNSFSLRGVAGSINSNVLQVFTVNRDLQIGVKCELSMKSESCSVIKVRPDNKILVVGCGDGRVRIYSWKTLRLLASLNDHSAVISDVQFTVEPVQPWRTKIMAVACADGVVSLWNIYN